MGTLNTAFTGNDAESIAALNELASSINSRMSGSKNYVPIQKLEIEGDEVLIHKKGGEIERVDITDMSTRDIGSSIWNDVTGGEVSFADALAMYEKGGGSLGKYRKGDRGGRQTNVDKIENADYNSKIRIDGKDDDVQSFVDAVDNIGGGDTVADVAPDYSNILQEVFKTSTTPGLVEAFKGVDINVTAGKDEKDNETLVFKIGDMTFTYPNDMVDWNEGETIGQNKWDSSDRIWPAMQDFIAEAISQKKTGKKYKKETTNEGDNILDE